VFGLLLAVALAGAPCAPVVDVRGPGLPDDVVASFADDARAAVVDVRARLGSTRCDPFVITLVPAMADAPRLDPPWHLPTWAAGAAEPRARRIVVGVTVDGALQDRQRTLVHEVAHVVAAEAVGDRRLPRWLDEGIARVIAGEHGIEDLSRLAHARVGDRFLPLLALVDGFPPAAADAGLAYAEAGRAVSLLVGRTPDVLPRLLARIGAGHDVDDALVHVAGRATWQLDQDVRRSVSGWTALATVGIETDLAMAACAVVVVVVGVRARRRLRRRIESMDDAPGLPFAVTVTRFRHGPAPVVTATSPFAYRPPSTLARRITAW
jgi:hypothetical protein